MLNDGVLLTSCNCVVLQFGLEPIYFILLPSDLLFVVVSDQIKLVCVIFKDKISIVCHFKL